MIIKNIWDGCHKFTVELEAEDIEKPDQYCKQNIYLHNDDGFYEYIVDKNKKEGGLTLEERLKLITPEESEQIRKHHSYSPLKKEEDDDEPNLVQMLQGMKSEFNFIYTEDDASYKVYKKVDDECSFNIRNNIKS